MHKRYSTDLTDQQWGVIEPLIPPAKDGGRPRTADMREVVNTCLYILRTGCQWEMIPNDFPPKSTVYEYYSQWAKDGTLDEMLRQLCAEVRVKAGRNPKPTAAIIDSQSVKTAGPALEVGYDGAKKTKGRKRHIAVDVLGLLLAVVVHSAGISERAGAKLVMANLMAYFTDIKIVWADGGYSGNTFVSWIKTIFNVIWQVIKRPRKVFQIVKFRWIVERTFGWMNYQRRLSKDYEYSPRHAEAWIKLAAINTMTRRLSPG
jgi:putative transposase